MDRILDKQFLLTGYLEYLLLKNFSDNSEGVQNGNAQNGHATNGSSEPKKLSLKIITPSDPIERGCQLSLVFSADVTAVHKELEKRAIVVSSREHF